MNRAIERIGILAVVTSISFACSDPSSPVEMPRAKTTVVAQSPTSFSSLVGREVPASVIPAVLVQDLTGTPVSGVVVVFSVDGGGGSTKLNIVTSNSLGIAQAKNWGLGSKAGVNVMTAYVATGGSVSFSAVGTPDEPTDIQKLAGDNQSVAARSDVPVKPSVRVVDEYGNAIQGIVVTFAIGLGGGSIAGGEVTTDANGTATVGGWTLGARGDQSVVASVPKLLPRTFLATAIPSFTACGSVLPLTVGTTVSRVLSPADCETSDGIYYHTYKLTLRDAATVFTLNSTAFDTYLEVRGPALLASNIHRKGEVSRGIKTILPAGDYTVLVSSVNSNAVGAYTLSAMPGAVLVSGCEEAYIARGTISYQATGDTDCVIAQNTNADRFQIYLQKGSVLTVQLEDLSYSNHSLTLTNASGDMVAVANIQNYYFYTLSFAAPVDGFYTINAMNSDNDYAEYRLTIK